MNQPPLTETLLLELIEAARHLALAPRPACHHLTRILAQVGSVVLCYVILLGDIESLDYKTT